MQCMKGDMKANKTILDHLLRNARRHERKQDHLGLTVKLSSIHLYHIHTGVFTFPFTQSLEDKPLPSYYNRKMALKLGQLQSFTGYHGDVGYCGGVTHDTQTASNMQLRFATVSCTDS